MRRFEFSEGTSNKFWEIEAKAKEIRIRFGKLGSGGQLKLQTFGSPAEATASMAKQIAEKTKKGYTESGGPAAGKPAAATSTVTSTVKPTALKITELKTQGISPHRVVLIDDDVGHCVVGTGSSCVASSDGKHFWRRDSPGTAYYITKFDNLIVTLGEVFATSKDLGTSWKQPKFPYDGNLFCILRDHKGLYWVGADEGLVFTSSHPDKGFVKAKWKSLGKIQSIVEIDDKLFVVGVGCVVWDGKKATPLKGTTKKETMTRIIEGPNGGIALMGDGGVTYFSKDRGKTFVKTKSGVKVDLEDCAYVAGALFAVGGGWSEGVVLRSDDEGKTWKKVPIKASSKLWGIRSWGDGAFLTGDCGVFTLAAPNDPYWRGPKDRFEPEPAKIDELFTPNEARAGKDRESTYKKLLASAIADHTRISAKQRSTRKADDNAKLAAAVDDGIEGAEAVYADWLTDSGDPRGEFAQIQLRLHKDPKNKDLKKAEKAMIKAHGDAWIGRLAGVPDLVELKWYAGYIAQARIAMSYERDEDFGSSDGDGDSDDPKPAVDLLDVLKWLLDSPSARFLRELTIGIVTMSENDYGAVNKEIGKRYLPSLRTLFIGDFHSEETELNWSTLSKVEPVYAAVPNLETLKLRSGTMSLGTIVLPKLKSFEVETGGMDAKSLRSIATAVWPSLESLSIQCGPEPEGAAPKPADFQPILDGENLPHLTHLGLDNLNFTGALIEPLATSKILPQLTQLDMRMGTLGDEHVAKIFAWQKAFAHLSKLDLDDNFLTGASKTLLKKAKIPFEFGEQREDEGDPSDRYASAYE